MVRGLGLLGTMIAVAEELSGKDEDSVDATMSGRNQGESRVQESEGDGRNDKEVKGRKHEIEKSSYRVKQKQKRRADRKRK